MRRFGGLLFLVLLAACQPRDGRLESSGPPPEQPTSTSTSSTPSTSTTSTSSTTTTTTTVVRTTTTAQPVATTAAVARPAATTTTAASGGCDPNYAGACVPIASDVDCGGGSGNGPAYVYAKNFRVVGRDIYRLDTDGNGIACES